ncbi:S-adenosyl-L-methionine-dependent methyltransferase [Clavulina sp. PMI_390]|nr:S-adenosyl-L-methionine-dependent methyltransferase [Clavulina sp. PMI_390]
MVADHNELYGNVEYWNDRYREEGDSASFDWFKEYHQISDIINEIIPNKNSRILMLGCGNSTLSADMYADGFDSIVNIDYSSVVIDSMKRRHSDKTMEWTEMDIRDLNFDDSTFDVALDKGTMDAMMTAKGSVWNPPAQVVEDCTKEIDEVIRVLRKSTGVFIYITFGQPHFRRRFLTREGWSLEIRELGETFHYYCYIMRPVAS